MVAPPLFSLPAKARKWRSPISTRDGEETAHLAGNGAIAIHADVTDPDSLQAALRATIDKFGRLDVLHNNAGGSTAQDDTAVNAPLDEFWRAISSTSTAPFSVAALASPS